MDKEEPLFQWYCTEANDSNPQSRQSRNTTPDTSKKVTWSNNTELLVTNPPHKLVKFQLNMDLMYLNGEGNNVTIFCEGASANGIFHTILI